MIDIATAAAFFSEKAFLIISSCPAKSIPCLNLPALPITNYKYEENLENKKREIFILKPEYISVVLDDIEDITKYKKGSTEYIDETLKRAENIRLFQ